MSRKLISAVCLLVLAASHAAALAGPLLAGGSPDCCNATLCSMHRHRQPAPAKPECHQRGDAGLADCAMRSCNPPEHRAISLQPYLLPESPLAGQEAPLAFAIPPAALFFPAPATDTDSPPPRTHLS